MAKNHEQKMRNWIDAHKNNSTLKKQIHEGSIPSISPYLHKFKDYHDYFHRKGAEKVRWRSTFKSTSPDDKHIQIGG